MFEPLVLLSNVLKVAPSRAATPLTLRQLPMCRLSRILVRAAICARTLAPPPTDKLLPVRLKDLILKLLPAHCLSKIDSSLHLANDLTLMDELNIT